MLQLLRLRKGVRILTFGLVVLSYGAAVAQGKPRRVVSLNLCADQLLLTLADRDQIASVSPLARDASISFLAGRVDRIPGNGGKGEAILFSGADLVIASSFDARLHLAMLESQGLEVMILDPWVNLDQGREQIRVLARRLGHPERGERLVGGIDAALQRTENIVPGQPSILTYYRRGWVPSSRSFLSELLQHMGFRLHQDRLGLARGGVARLETIVATPPDYALMDDIVGRSIDHGSALLVHPALVETIPPERRLILPSRLTICGGPSTPAAIDALAAEIKAKVR